MNASYVQHALKTAWRIARFEENAIADFDQSTEGFFRSFFGIILCAPLYLIIVVTERRMAETAATEIPSLSLAPLPPAGFALAAVESLNYLSNWLVFPIAMIFIAQLLSAGHRYVTFIIAYNWTACIVIALITVPHFLYLIGAVPLSGVIVLYYPVMLFALVYLWRVARDGLGVSGLNAAGIVIIDSLLGLIVAAAVAPVRTSLGLSG